MKTEKIVEILKNYGSTITLGSYRNIASEISKQQDEEIKATTLFHTDKEIEEYIWEEISVPLSQIDIDYESDNYLKYLNAVYWAKWGRDNCSKIK